MPLSEFTIRHARITGKNYTLGDFDGLSLWVTKAGSKLWLFRYYWEGRQQRMSLGTYPEVSLKQARSRRDDARRLLADNINPCEHRKQQRHAAEVAEKHTFEAVYNEWVNFRRLILKEGRQSTLSQILRVFKKDILPTLGERPIKGITRHDLMGVLSVIEQRNALTMAEKCRTWFNQLFRYALVKVEGLEVNPASDLDVVALPKPPVTNNPFLRMEQLPELLSRIRNYGGQLQTKLGLRLLLLTGVRTGELRYATPDQFDLEKQLWVIPPEVVKQLQVQMRKPGRAGGQVPPYIVPLSVQALEIVRYMLDQVLPAQRFLFSHRSNLQLRISENTLNNALHRMGLADQLTGHGMRATISTALHEIGYPKNWIDAQLSHADPDQVSATYNHARYVEQRRTMMQDWANRLDLWAQGKHDAASSPLTIRLEGAVSVAGAVAADAASLIYEVESKPKRAAHVVEGVDAVAVMPERNVMAAPVSEIQRQRLAMLAAYEAPTNLTVPEFARLAGKSREQVSRDIKEGRLLAISLGNRGLRLPDWQLDASWLGQTQRALMTVEAHWDAYWVISKRLALP
ncbi:MULTISPECIES: tyrosine-type recombinase/integrase [unclassified Pseudomonas]|nr:MULTISPECIES: integrase arm-type DNA-binding domain-containing protein [unclassified Pseudomonas]